MAQPSRRKNAERSPERKKNTKEKKAIGRSTKPGPSVSDLQKTARETLSGAQELLGLARDLVAVAAHHASTAPRHDAPLAAFETAAADGGNVDDETAAADTEELISSGFSLRIVQNLAEPGHGALSDIFVLRATAVGHGSTVFVAAPVPISSDLPLVRGLLRKIADADAKPGWKFKVNGLEIIE